MRKAVGLSLAIALSTLTIALSTLTSGCRDNAESAAEAPREVELFEKGRGLRLPEETVRSLGVETVDVIEKPSSGGEPALFVPESSVIRGATESFVYVLNGEHFTRTTVKVGRTADAYIEILDGLYAGDVVVCKAVEPMWMIELYAIRGGTPCCPVPKKNTAMN